MKKELLKLQARNREINDRLTAMYVKAENEKREFNDEENREEREARELAEREQKEREAVAVMRMRRNRLALQNRDIETFSY